ncbi:DUF2683 family protein [Candidatus Woesearchaeota archaeon]|nr:DUF2683 family protein [Candidatus Woesearchaeota archaeon]
MVQAIINIDEHTNQVLNIVKAKFGLKDKSSAIEVVVGQYEEEILEPRLKPEFIAKMKRRQKEKPIKIGSMKDFRKHFGIKK